MTPWTSCPLSPPFPFRGGGILTLGLARVDGLLPLLVRALDDLDRRVPVEPLAVECELVLPLPLGDLVRAEPLTDSVGAALHVVGGGADVRRGRVLRVVRADGEDLPVRLAAVEHRERAEHADAVDRSGCGGEVGREVAHVDGVAVAEEAGPLVRVRGVLVRLRDGTVVDDGVELVEAGLAVLGLGGGGVRGGGGGGGGGGRKGGVGVS
jgi:hypothetical protein